MYHTTDKKPHTTQDLYACAMHDALHMRQSVREAYITDYTISIGTLTGLLDASQEPASAYTSARIRSLILDVQISVAAWAAVNRR